jgi:hypothetical protein
MLTCSQIDRAGVALGTGAAAAVGVFCGENKALLLREFLGRGVGVVGPGGASEFSPRSGVPGRAPPGGESSTSMVEGVSDGQGKAQVISYQSSKGSCFPLVVVLRGQILSGWRSRPSRDITWCKPASEYIAYKDISISHSTCRGILPSGTACPWGRARLVIIQ